MKRILVGAASALLSLAALAATTVPSSLINWVTAPSAPSQTAKYVFAAPNASAGVPTFRLLLASDISGLGTAATVNTGTSGATIPLLNGANTWAAAQTFSVRPTFNGATPWDSTNLVSPALASGNLSQFASTTSAQLATVLSDETGTGANVFAVTPTLTSPNIIGTISGGNAAAGSLGEYATNTTSGTSLSNGVAANATSVSLTAGDWDVSGEVTYSAGAGCIPTVFQQSISTTSATGGGSGNQTLWSNTFSTASTNVMPTPRVRVSLSATTTVYLIGAASFSGGTMTAAGFIRARRIR